MACSTVLEQLVTWCDLLKIAADGIVISIHIDSCLLYYRRCWYDDIYLSNLCNFAKCSRKQLVTWRYLLMVAADAIVILFTMTAAEDMTLSA